MIRIRVLQHRWTPDPWRRPFPRPTSLANRPVQRKVRVIGEKLLAFVREVLRLREVVEEAMERDDVAASLMQQDEKVAVTDHGGPDAAGYGRTETNACGMRAGQVAHEPSAF